MRDVGETLQRLILVPSPALLCATIIDFACWGIDRVKTDRLKWYARIVQIERHSYALFVVLGYDECMRRTSDGVSSA